MKTYIQIIAVAIIGFSTVSCGKRSPQDTGLEYASQMYHSAPLDPYSQRDRNAFFADGKNLREPVAGTVAKGKEDYYYPYENTPEDAERAAKELKNPTPLTKESVDRGKELYTIYCSHCHGKTGKGDGSVIASGKYPAQPPSYDSDRVKELTDGKIFHSITKGINVMGPHGAFLSPKERWDVVNYIKSVRGDKVEGMGGGAKSDSTKTDSTKVKEEKKS